ncbi:MAG TPA: ATP synthase F0 subunit B [Pyrinomonadaceae bacterium]|nr:ATP synthase F0 subunit B [Pyrinomonadaceae bacterium]
MVLLAFAENSIQLVPDGTLFVHILVIAGMIAILNLTLFKPINRILEEREKETRGGLRQAKATMASVAERLALYEQRLREARAEGYLLLERERAGALDERVAKVDKLRQEISGLLNREKDEVGRQAAAARETLAGEAGRIGAEISSHILGRRVG